MCCTVLIFRKEAFHLKNYDKGFLRENHKIAYKAAARGSAPNSGSGSGGKPAAYNPYDINCRNFAGRMSSGGTGCYNFDEVMLPLREIFFVLHRRVSWPGSMLNGHEAEILNRSEILRYPQALSYRTVRPAGRKPGNDIVPASHRMGSSADLAGGCALTDGVSQGMSKIEKLTAAVVPFVLFDDFAFDLDGQRRQIHEEIRVVQSSLHLNRIQDQRIGDHACLDGLRDTVKCNIIGKSS